MTVGSVPGGGWVMSGAASTWEKGAMLSTAEELDLGRKGLRVGEQRRVCIVLLVSTRTARFRGTGSVRCCFMASSYRTNAS
jgi:hypothetical protein